MLFASFVKEINYSIWNVPSTYILNRISLIIFLSSSHDIKYSEFYYLISYPNYLTFEFSLPYLIIALKDIF